MRTKTGALRDWTEDEGTPLARRAIILDGPASICGYVGVPMGHPLAGKNYDDMPLDVHGGLTFASEGGRHWPEGWYWYGWDYAHLGDITTYDLKYRKNPERDAHLWTVEEVEAETRGVMDQLRDMMAEIAAPDGD